jgi:hypothetical protein
VNRLEGIERLRAKFVSLVVFETVSVVVADVSSARFFHRAS